MNDAKILGNSTDIQKKMEKGPWQNIGNKFILSTKHCQRLHAKAGKRKDLTLIHKNGRFYAMEAWCSHAGGPLFKGDIEDFKGKAHIMCPWHGYMFDLETGKNELGIQQETFPVKVENSDVYVQYDSMLSTTPFQE